MSETNVQKALKIRVASLALRITELETAMMAARTPDRMEKLGTLRELQQREAHLEALLGELDGGSRGWSEDVKANLDLLADNIQGGLDNLMFATDAHYLAGEPAPTS
jgi:hypothetical protein